jgi:hypothetical protein
MGRTSRARILAIATAAGCLGICSAAFASIHKATVEWEEPTAPPTLGTPKDPPAEHPYLSKARVSYDDVAGTVRLAYTFYDNAAWVRTEGPPLLTVSLGATCSGPPELAMGVTDKSSFGLGPDGLSSYARSRDLKVGLKAHLRRSTGRNMSGRSRPRSSLENTGRASLWNQSNRFRTKH